MLDAILKTLAIIGWLGIILGALVIVNIICGTMYNICAKGEKFDWKKMLKGILKALIFYASALLASVAFTMLPFINEMIIEAFGQELISTEILNTLSNVAVISIVIATIVIQSKKAIEGIAQMANWESSDEEKITWKVEDE